MATRILGIICLLILGIGGCDHSSDKTPPAAQQAASQAGPKPFKNEVYRAIDDREVVTITSPTELELQKDGSNYICGYTRQDNGIRVVLTVLGSKQAVYLSTVAEGLKEGNSLLYDAEHYKPVMDAINARRRRAALSAQLLEAAKEPRDADSIIALLDAGADPNGGALKLVIESSTTDMAARLLIVKALLAHGADPNIASPEVGFTPLMSACSMGNLQVIQMLLDHHADVNAHTRHDQTTALMEASLFPRGVGAHDTEENAETAIAMITLLLKAGADRHAKDCYGREATEYVNFWKGHDRKIDALANYKDKEAVLETEPLSKAKEKVEGQLPPDKPFVANTKAMSDAQGEMVIASLRSGDEKSRKRDWDGSIAEFGRAIELDPKNAFAYIHRGWAKQRKDDLAGALADYNRALELDPKNAVAYYSRGVLRYDGHAFTEALVDLLKAIEVNPATQDAEYSRFRVFLIRTRLGDGVAATTELRKYLANRSTGNPGDRGSQVGQFLIGQLADGELLASATNVNPNTQAWQLCSAYFYCGSKHLVAGDKATAADCFNKCLATGQQNMMEYTSAAAELNFLKAKKN